jgi:hypothetical protein
LVSHSAMKPIMTCNWKEVLMQSLENMFDADEADHELQRL